MRIVGHQNFQRPIEDRGQSRFRRDWRRRRPVVARLQLRAGARPRDRREQLSAPHRFDEVVINSHRAQTGDLAGQVVGAEHHHEPPPVQSLADELPGRLESAAPRERAVEQYDWIR